MLMQRQSIRATKQTRVQKQTHSSTDEVYGKAGSTEQWERTVMTVLVAGPHEHPRGKMKFDPYLPNTQKPIPGGLHVKGKTIKLLHNMTEEYLYYLGV